MIPASQRIHRVHGFTLVEVMVVVVIIGLIAALAVPGYRRITLRSKATALVNDIKSYSAVFTQYSLQNGRWPAEVDPGQVPAEVADSLGSGFTRPSPIGGLYDWDQDVAPNGFNTKAAITVATAGGHAMTDDLELVEMVDEIMDDGNLTTGNVRLGSTNGLVFILEL